jgi:hypothetical protein
MAGENGHPLQKQIDEIKMELRSMFELQQDHRRIAEIQNVTLNRILDVLEDIRTDFENGSFTVVMRLCSKWRTV